MPAPSSLPPAPAHLSERARQLWGLVVAKRATSPGRLALLQAALEALDRAEQCREVLAREGLTTTTEQTKAVHVHPLLKAEAESRRQFATIWSQQLHLAWDPSIDGGLGGVLGD